MASKKQIAANRRNAKKSTGPRTKTGKKRASRNPLKHGLRALDVLTPDESPADYEAFREGGLMDLKPVGFLETELAEKIINTGWRLRRCERIEAGLLGGGKHVMEEIEATSPRKFARMLQYNPNGKDQTLSQCLQQMLVMRLGAHATGEPEKDRSFAHVSTEDLASDLMEVREEERQRNPLSYDVALAFNRDSSEQDALTKLARYEAGLDRGLQRAVRDFKQLQSERRAQAAEAARVTDVIDLNQQKS
jgi:hypothetical protein